MCIRIGAGKRLRLAFHLSTLSAVVWIAAKLAVKDPPHGPEAIAATGTAGLLVSIRLVNFRARIAGNCARIERS